jgi:hypothetical protein
MVILYGSGSSPMTSVTGDLDSAFDGGLWDKPGITSSIARQNSRRYGLGYAEATAIGATSFDGVTLGGNAVLVKYTLLGDANLDGSVNFSDYSILQNHFGQAAGWSSGDFNYDGTVNFNDFSILQNNYGSAAEANLVSGSSVTTSSATDGANRSIALVKSVGTGPGNARKSKVKSKPITKRSELKLSL